MARFDASGLDDIVDQMARMKELTGDVADEMLMAGAEKMKEAWKQAAEEYELRDTGDMIESIGYPKHPKTVDGVRTIDVYPRGTDRKGVRNAEKAFVLHYGSTSIEGTHWVERAEELSTEPVEKAMRSIWEEELKRRGL